MYYHMTRCVVQVVSDYRTPIGINPDQKYIQALGKPVVIYTYHMAFTRAATGAVA